MIYNGRAGRLVGRSEGLVQNTFDIQQRVQHLLTRLPLRSLEGLLVMLEALVAKEAGETLAEPPPPQYDFSDLTGRLCWRGDAVKVQQALRDEW
jgi:hypothetical protein